MRRLVATILFTATAACGLTSLDDLRSDASVDGAGGDGNTDSSTDAIADVRGDASDDGDDAATVPGLLCGSNQCNPLDQLCCTDGVTAFCSQQCAGPSWAFGCDDSRQCIEKQDGAAGWACCLQSLDAGTYVASLCGKGCARVVCNPTSPNCPNSLSCTGLETVDNYPLHFCQ